MFVESAWEVYDARLEGRSGRMVECWLSVSLGTSGRSRDRRDDGRRDVDGWSMDGFASK